MSDDAELASVLRETFREHEDAVDGLRDGLVPAARARARRRRTWQAVAGAAAATAVVLGGIGLAAALPRLGHPVTPSDSSGPTLGPTAGPTGGPPPGGGDLPHDWVWISSLGLEIGVPGGWAVNDYACNQTDRPSVVRALGAMRECLTPEPPNKQLAVIGNAPEREYPDDFRTTALTIDGVAATRTEGRLPDGRYAAQLAIPSRGIYLDVRTRDAAERDTILGTARLVEVDHVGCPVRRDGVTADDPETSTLVPADATLVRICYFGPVPDSRLQASAEIEAAPLVAAVNAAAPGMNPDPSAATCADVGTWGPDALLLFVSPGDRPGGTTSRLWVTFSHCHARGLDTGRRQAHVSADILHMFMPVLHTGYAFHGDLAGYPTK